MIIVRLSGGMGNQMFQYAIGRALSLKHNTSLKLDVTFLNHRIKLPYFLRPNFSFRNFDLDVFNIHAEIAKPEEISFWNRPILWGKSMLVIDAALRKLAILPGWEKSFSFDKNVLDFGSDKYLQGFWQSEKYFLDYKDQIREDFTPKKQMSEEYQKLFNEIKGGNSLCVHLRRMHGGGSFHGKYDMKYYESGIRRITENKRIDKIYVFSDDIGWCKENVKFPHPTVFVEEKYAGEKAEGHLFLMSACRYFVISNSTFSWWAAWLAENSDKIVIAPKKWFRDESINTNDLIPDSWIRI